MNDTLIAAIIDMALDDLAEGRTDLPTILRLVATVAWHEGHREAAYELSRNPPASQSATRRLQPLPFEHPALRSAPRLQPPGLRPNPAPLQRSGDGQGR